MLRNSIVLIALFLRARPKAERVLLRIRENPEYERPAVVTLLRGLYLWNRKPDWQAVFFGGYPHSFCRVWDQCRIMPVPTVARGACYMEGCHKCSACCFSVAAGPIALTFCGCGIRYIFIFQHRKTCDKSREQGMKIGDEI